MTPATCSLLVCLVLSKVVCHAYILRNLSDGVYASAGDVRNVAETQLQPKEKLKSEGNDVVDAARDIISSGLESIKSDIEKVPDNVDNAKPSDQDWKRLNKTLEEFFDKYKKDTSGQNNITVQTIRDGFQNLTENFVPKLKRGSVAQKDYERQIQRPGFIAQIFSGGTQQVAANINNLADTTTTTTQRTNFIHNVINSFSGSNQENAPQQETQSTTPPSGFFQGALNQINKVVSNFLPTTTTTIQPNPVDIMQNFGTQIDNIYSQVNGAGQGGTTGSPHQAEVGTEGSGQNGQNVEPVVAEQAVMQDSANVPTSSVPMEMFMCFNMAKMMNNYNKQK